MILALIAPESLALRCVPLKLFDEELKAFKQSEKLFNESQKLLERILRDLEQDDAQQLLYA